MPGFLAVLPLFFHLISSGGDMIALPSNFDASEFATDIITILAVFVPFVGIFVAWAVVSKSSKRLERS